MPSAELYDTHDRKIEYMRVSLTDRCNYRCVYCMPPQGEAHIPHEEILRYEELLRVCRITSKLGISRYKITGGEPLCRTGAVDFIRQLKSLPDVFQTTITTNGALLDPKVNELADIGVDGINVSLDTLAQDHYNSITRTKIAVDRVLPAMAKAKSLGIRVKINVVPLKEYNEDDLPDLTRFALETGYHIRFIELMPVGRGKVHNGVPQDHIRDMIEKRFGPMTPLNRVIGNGPAECFSVEGFAGSVGFISALSKKFCHTCNRIRLTSLGFLKTCLHHNIGVDLKPFLRGGASDDDITDAILGAVSKKPMAHEFSRTQAQGEPKTFYMNSVGG